MKNTLDKLTTYVVNDNQLKTGSFLANKSQFDFD